MYSGKAEYTNITKLEAFQEQTTTISDAFLSHFLKNAKWIVMLWAFADFWIDQSGANITDVYRYILKSTSTLQKEMSNERSW